jgi:hypothetical protein
MQAAIGLPSLPPHTAPRASAVPKGCGGVFAAAFGQHVFGRAAHTGGHLDDRPEPEHQLRVSAVAEPGPDEVAKPAKLKRLGVQRGCDPAGARGEQDPLQGLPGIDPVRRAVSRRGEQRGDPGGPERRRRAEWRQAPAAAVGEVPAGKGRIGVLCPRQVGGRRYPVGSCAVRRGSPPGELPDALALELLCVFGCRNGRGERGPPSVVCDDAQRAQVRCRGTFAQLAPPMAALMAPDRCGPEPDDPRGVNALVAGCAAGRLAPFS